jgi:hypothetical protein
MFPLDVLPTFSGPLLIGLSCLLCAGCFLPIDLSNFLPVCRSHFPLAYLATHFEGLKLTLVYLGCHFLFSSMDLIGDPYPCPTYFIPEGGGSVFLWNTGYYLLDYMTSYLRCLHSYPKTCIHTWTQTKKTPLEIDIIYLGNKVIYWIFKTCCIISVLFYTKFFLFHNFIFFCSNNIFVINHMLILIYLSQSDKG